MRKNKTKLHIICGFVGSGKTTLAKKLEKQYGAIRFSTDEWMIELFNFNGSFGKKYKDSKKRCKEFIWKLSKKILLSGRDVVLDFGFWSRKERALFVKRARLIGAEPILYFLDVPIEQLRRRVNFRNKKLDTKTFNITEKWFNKWLPLFESPEPTEKPIIIKSSQKFLSVFQFPEKSH
jgi:predicted kinase